MLIATKHIVDNNFVFQEDSALAHLVCSTVQTSQLHLFLTCDPNSSDVIAELPWLYDSESHTIAWV